MLLAISEFQETQLGVYRETIRNFDSKELPGEVCLLRYEMRHLQSCLICTFQLYSWYHASNDNNNNNNNDYFTCIQNMKLVTNKYKSGGLYEKHVVATWKLGNHLSICL